MEDFDYSEYPTKILRDAIRRCQWHLDNTKSRIKSMEKKLVSRRGYSHKQLDAIAFHCRSAYVALTSIETEIEECTIEIESRG